MYKTSSLMSQADAFVEDAQLKRLRSGEGSRVFPGKNPGLLLRDRIFILLFYSSHLQIPCQNACLLV